MADSSPSSTKARSPRSARRKKSTAAPHPLRRGFRGLVQRAAARADTRLGGPCALVHPAPRSAAAAAAAGRALSGTGHRFALSGRGHAAWSIDGARAPRSPCSFQPASPSRTRATTVGLAFEPDALHVMEDARMTAPRSPCPNAGLGDRLTGLFWRRPNVLLILLLAPPLIWLGVVYLGSLAALLLQSFYSIDEFPAWWWRNSRSRPMLELLRAVEFRHHPAHGRDGRRRDAGLRRHRLSHRLFRRAICRGAGRRPSTWASCCPCGRAIWSRSMPGS